MAEYELVFACPDSVQDDVVVMRPTGGFGPGGHPLYEDDSGILRAEISDRSEVRMMATGWHQEPCTPVEVRNR